MSHFQHIIQQNEHLSYLEGQTGRACAESYSDCFRTFELPLWKECTNGTQSQVIMVIQ